MNAYDVIFIGTPIWASSFTPLVNTFISSAPLQSKKLMLFACSSGGGAKKCFEKMKARLVHNDIIGEIDFKDPTENDLPIIQKQIKSWLSAVAL